MEGALPLAGGEAAADPRLAARGLGALYLAGAAIGLVSLILPHPPRADVAGLYSNVGLAFAGGLALLGAASRVRAWMLHVALVAGALLIARAVVLSHDAQSFYSVWFLWIGLYAVYFFDRAAAAAHLALVAALYAATLIHDPPSSALARWLTTMATLVVAGIFIDTLVRRSRRQARAATASADSMMRVTDLAHELASISDSAAVRPAICRGAVRVTQADHGALWEPRDGGPELGRATAAGEATDRAPALAPAAARRAFTGGASLTEGPGEGRSGVRLWQPVVRGGQTVAVLELAWEDATRFEAEPVARLAELLAVEIAVTLQRVELLSDLETIARTDELTGLPNRRAWQELLPRLMTRAGRSGEVVSVAILDLDHFKRYNDTRGHQAGDRLLKQLAGAWSGELRPTDLLVRYGGEEFALALPGCPLGEAAHVVERLRGVVPEGETCSAGIATWDGREATAELLGRADRALYGAKRGGRDRIAVGDEEPSPPTPTAT